MTSRCGRSRGRVVDDLGTDPQPFAGDACADDGALHGPQDGGHGAVGQLAHVLDVGDGAHLGVAALDLGDEEDAAVALAGAGSGATSVV